MKIVNDFTYGLYTQTLTEAMYGENKPKASKQDKSTILGIIQMEEDEKPIEA